MDGCRRRVVSGRIPVAVLLKKCDPSINTGVTISASTKAQVLEMIKPMEVQS